MAHRARVKEVLNCGADDFTALRPQDHGELVRQRRLAGTGDSVDSDPRWVRHRDGSDCLSYAKEQLVAGAVAHILLSSVQMARYADSIYRSDISKVRAGAFRRNDPQLLIKNQI